MYFKGAIIENIIFYGAVYHCVFWLTVVTYHIPCRSLEKCLALVTTVEVVHSPVNSHNHYRNLIQTRGQPSQQCKIYRQGAVHFLKNPRD